jgi:hypothetical protein
LLSKALRGTRDELCLYCVVLGHPLDSTARPRGGHNADLADIF